MAAKKTKKKTAHSSTTLARAPRGAQEIVVTEVRTPARHAKKGHRVGGKTESSQKTLMGLALGGYILGFIDKSAKDPASALAKLPTIPMLGKAGTIAVAAHFIGKGKKGVLTDVRNAAAAVAAYEMGATGTIAGDLAR